MSSVLAVSLLGGCRASDKPVTLTVWTYYNGDQLASFERLVEEFNTTIGKKEHITVEASSQGSINDLEKNVLDAAKGRVGALAMPNIFSAYADTAYTLEQMGQVVDLSPYLTEKEKAAYLPNYLEEGDFSDDGSIHIILTTSTKFLRIMEMASIELGGYEMRFDLNTVYVTKNFFPCSTFHLKMSPGFPPGISSRCCVNLTRHILIPYGSDILRCMKFHFLTEQSATSVWRPPARVMRRSDLSKILPPLCWNGSAWSTSVITMH